MGVVESLDSRGRGEAGGGLLDGWLGRSPGCELPSVVFGGFLLSTPDEPAGLKAMFFNGLSWPGEAFELGALGSGVVDVGRGDFSGLAGGGV